MISVFVSGNGDTSRRETSSRGSALIKGIAVLLAAVGVVGCGAEAPGGAEPIDSVEQDWGLNGFNGISPDCISGNFLHRSKTDEAGVTTPVDAQLTRLCEQPAQGGLCELKAEWAKWLNPNGVDPPEPDTVLRGQLLGAMIQCALPTDTTVLVSAGVSVRGMFKAFPGWADSSLRTDEQEMLSGCVAAKVNAFGATVPIGLVGPGPGLDASTPVEDPSFHYQEAVYFGTLFGLNPVLYACTGDQNSGGNDVVGIEQRVCSQPGNPCNIQALGPCNPFVCAGGWGNPGLPTGAYCQGAADLNGNKWAFPATVYMQVK